MLLYYFLLCRRSVCVIDSFYVLPLPHAGLAVRNSGDGEQKYRRLGGHKQIDGRRFCSRPATARLVAKPAGRLIFCNDFGARYCAAASSVASDADKSRESELQQQITARDEQIRSLQANMQAILLLLSRARDMTNKQPQPDSPHGGTTATGSIGNSTSGDGGNDGGARLQSRINAFMKSSLVLG
jgi:hypothetical protein